MSDDPYKAPEQPDEPRHEDGRGVLPASCLLLAALVIGVFYLLYYFFGPAIG